MIDQPDFSVSKGDWPVELVEAVARFGARALRDLSDLNWSGEWAFWEWFWALLLVSAVSAVAWAWVTRVKSARQPAA